MKKPHWVIDKEREKQRQRDQTIWLFGLHAVRDALENEAREKMRLIVTKNASDKLAEAIAASGMTPEIGDARNFPAPLDPSSVHQGAAIEVKPLDWGPLDGYFDDRAAGTGPLVFLDRISDPHNVGAILRSAEVFGARAVIGTKRHAAPESGALAKVASGALERQPYLRITNLVRSIEQARERGFVVLGLDGLAEVTLDQAIADARDKNRIALVLGAEGPGLREGTRKAVDQLVKIPFAGDFGSLNVSNAAAVALYAACRGSRL